MKLQPFYLAKYKSGATAASETETWLATSGSTQSATF